jgi:hypothetical protein
MGDGRWAMGDGDVLTGAKVTLTPA